MAHDQSTPDPRSQLDALYDEYRTACLNKKYYGRKLRAYKAYNLSMEIAIALFGAGTGGVGAWAIWQQGPGAAIWSVLAAISLVLTTLKPLLNFPSSIERYARLYGEYTHHFMSLKNLMQDVRANRGLSAEELTLLRSIRKSFAELARDDDPSPSVKLVRRLQSEVNAEIPVETLWYPEK